MSSDLGLLVLQEPATKVKATIIAVHGLNGHRTRTWTNTKVEPPFFWIKDGLEHDLPDCRILTYGYDASVISSSWKPHLSLRDHAANLHEDLRVYLDREPSPTPLIFLAHNMGGILVKQALVQSANSLTSVVHKSTAAILFFGTPHRGSDIASTAKTMVNVLSITGFNPNKSLIEPLSRDSTALQYINESWLHLPQTYEVYSFYETRASIGLQRNLVVNKEGATLNWPHERTIALDASHADMVKPPSVGSPTYLTVLNSLQSIIHRLPKSRPIARLPVIPKPPTGTPPFEAPRRIDFTGYVHLFKQNSLQSGKECLVSDMLEQPPTALHSDLCIKNPEDNLDPLVWVHVPLNNTAWVNPCLLHIASDQQTDLLITEQKYWLSHERKRQNLPHSRYFEPSCFLSGSDTSIQFVIYLPYIHWDTTECFTRRSEYFKATKNGSKVDIPDDLSEQAKSVYRIIRDDSGKTSSLHPRRSLDQFFYSSLPETSFRDQTQVVSKYMPKDSRGGKKMIMVDQLWLWLLETHDPASPDKIKSTIFTSFPRKEKEADVDEKDLEDIADLRQAIIDEANSQDSDWATNRINYVGLIIDQAVNVMLRVRTEESLDFLSVFRAAIGQATEDQTTYFRKFQDQLKSGSDEISDPQMKRDEVKLALEISDIIDELNSINRVFEAQKDALVSAYKIFSARAKGGPHRGRYMQLSEKLSEIIDQDIDGYTKQIKRMTADAQRTKDSIKDLLDLQQKEETLKEAHYSNKQADAAREQADATEAQSQILFLFTIVTIVFAPLSFFTSYYGMNVREFTGDNGNTNQRAVWKVMGPFSVAIIFGLLGGAYYMYKHTQKEQVIRKAKRKAKDGKGGGKGGKK